MVPRYCYDMNTNSYDAMAGDCCCNFQFLLLEMCWLHIEPKLTIIVLYYNLLYHNSKWKYKKKFQMVDIYSVIYIYLWYIVCLDDIVKYQLVMLQWNIYCIMYYLTWVLYHNLDMKYTKGNFKWWTYFPVTYMSFCLFVFLYYEFNL